MPPASLKRQSCAVCGRGILYGERTYDYATPAGDVRDVCALCRPSAERVGWAPPGRGDHAAQSQRGSQAAENAPRAGGITSKLTGAKLGGSIGPKLSELLSPRPIPTRASRRTAESDDADPLTEPTPEPRVEAPVRRPSGDPVTDAVSTFNASELPRLVAGLSRSLGKAYAEVRVRSGAAVVTVAWELSWYTWEVDGLEIRQVGKGAEVTEREGPAPQWNARVEDDGRLTVIEPV